MKVALGCLTRGMDYDVPKQNLRVSHRRMPAIPKSRFVIRHVRGTRDLFPSPAAEQG